MRSVAPDASGLAFVLCTWQYLLPHHALSSVVRAITRSRAVWFKNGFIKLFAQLFSVDLTEAKQNNPEDYPCFNAFFTRALNDDARPLPELTDALAMPADGTVSAIGQLLDHRLIQAKGYEYSVSELLGLGPEAAELFAGGSFSTVYLSPRNYHRVHMPLDGNLRGMAHIPGRLFSVNEPSVRGIPRLFVRNERVASLFDTPAGPMAVVLVGALFVGSIDTVWSGTVTPATSHSGDIQRYGNEDNVVQLERGEEMGRFNMGSTVITVFAHDRVEWDTALAPGSAVRMGEALGRWR